MSPRRIPRRESHCYKLLQALYGLKQVHLAWPKKLCSDIANMGFKELPSAQCVYRRALHSGWNSFILVYVDDFLILAPNKLEFQVIVRELKELYDLRVADKVTLFFGVRLVWKCNSSRKLTALKLSQSLYTKSILRRLDYNTVNLLALPWYHHSSPDYQQRKTNPYCQWKHTNK